MRRLRPPHLRARLPGGDPARAGRGDLLPRVRARLRPAWHAVTTPDAKHAFLLTVELALIAVPLNTVFGVIMALLIVRHRFPGVGFVNAIVDLPLALSPVVVGFSLLLLYGRQGWFGHWLIDHGYRRRVRDAGRWCSRRSSSRCRSSCARSCRCCARSAPTRRPAASTLGSSGWQTFRRITLPAIRWAVAYGVVLTTARALGEFGAVSVVSGRIVGQTETLTIHVEAAYQGFDLVGAYAASVRARAARDRDARPDDPAQAEGGDPLMGIAARDVTKRFGEFTALDGVIDRGRDGLADRAARAERQRQVDAPARDRGPRAAGHGHRAARRPGRDRPAPAGARRSASSSSTTPPSST